MRWEPPARPEWVQAVNAGGILPISEVAELPFTRDALLAEARATGLGVDDGAESASSSAATTSSSRSRCCSPRSRTRPSSPSSAGGSPGDSCCASSRCACSSRAYVRDDPGVVDEEILEPLFVTGAPRTGTTILHAMLAQDPARRVPEGWELLRPVPPPSPDPAVFAADARIPLADRELRLPGQVAGELDAIHVYRGRMHKECVSSMSFSFRSEEFTARYHVPSYVDVRALRRARRPTRCTGSCSRSSNDGARPVHWVLKSPIHLHWLPTLFARVPRRPPGDHPPRSAHRAGVGHQPGGDVALGAQRPRRLRRDRPLPRTSVPLRASTVS